MHRHTARVVSAILLAATVTLSGCAGKDQAEGGIETPSDTDGSGKITARAAVTFVELGSVNCIPCRMMQPVMKEIETAYAGKVKVVFIDVLTERGRPYMTHFGAKMIPTQVFLDSTGTEFSRHTGFFPKDSIVALLASNGVAR